MGLFEAFIGVIFITAALTTICAAIDDWNWREAFLYVLGFYGVIAVFTAGLALIVHGI